MRIFVAGPTAGISWFNFPLFDETTDALVDLGHIVYSPAERDRDSGFDPTGLTGQEDRRAMRYDLREGLGADVSWITRRADAICLLPGWEDSGEAVAELALAAVVGLKAGYLADFGPRYADWSELVSAQTHMDTRELLRAMDLVCVDPDAST